MRCSYLNLQLIKSAVINRKGTFALLAPPAKGQGGQLPLLPPLFRRPWTLFCIVFCRTNTNIIYLSTNNSRSKQFPLIINCKFSGQSERKGASLNRTSLQLSIEIIRGGKYNKNFQKALQKKKSVQSSPTVQSSPVQRSSPIQSSPCFVLCPIHSVSYLLSLAHY